jgi:hypothetical protein
MNNRDLFLILSTVAIALVSSPQLRSEDEEPISKEFSYPTKERRAADAGIAGVGELFPAGD